MTTDEKTGCKLEGKIALVTGGTSGIGLATAKRFVAEGAYVFITGRREKELASAVKSIRGSVTGVQGDVSQIGDLERLFAQIKQEKGRLDIVFANAGIAKYAPLGEITEEFFDSIFDVNVKGLLFTVQKALPLLEDGAAIVLCDGSSGSTYGSLLMLPETLAQALLQHLAGTALGQMYSNPARVIHPSRALRNSSGARTSPRTDSQARTADAVSFHSGMQRSLRPLP